MNKEFKELQKGNTKVRKKIEILLNKYMMSDERDDTISLINELINNEIDQEKLCNN